MSVKVLHILNHSLPKTDGYAIRSSTIVRFQPDFDIDPVVLTSPSHPDSDCDVETINGCRHYRTHRTWIPPISFLSQFWSTKRMTKRVDEIVDQERPDILHAHSPALWGVAAARVAKRRNLPFVYEIRGLWEDAAVDQRKTTSRSFRYLASRRIETNVARAADYVITIAERLKEEFIERGIDRSKITVVGNGVDRETFYPRPPDGELEAKLKLQGRPRIGYIGTLYPWEGVDDLVRAVPRIRQRLPGVRVVIVGGGILDDQLRTLVKQLNISDCVNLVGNVPHTEITRYYSIMDILVYPRRSSRNTEMVTPLKPLEAMAMEKAVIGSNVGGIKELITPGTGLLFDAGDYVDLADKCVELMQNSELRQRLTDTAERNVVVARNWQQIASSYPGIYSKVVSGRGKRPSPQRLRATSSDSETDGAPSQGAVVSKLNRTK